MKIILIFIITVMLFCTIVYIYRTLTEKKKEKLLKCYLILLNYVLENGFGKKGICATITVLYYNTSNLDDMTLNDYKLFKNHFNKQKPKWYKYRKFYLHPTFNKQKIGDFYLWWDGFNKKICDEQRIEFIKHLIIKLS